MSPRSLIIVKNIALFFFLSGIALTISLEATVKSYREAILLKNFSRDSLVVIDGKNCPNHGSISYTLQIKEKLFHKVSNHCSITCEEAVVGGSLPVHYMENDPSINDCGDTEYKVDKALISVYGLICVCLIFGIIAIFKCRKEVRAYDLSFDTDATTRRST